MTGPEHYREAEEILTAAKEADSDADRNDIALLLQFASVHAQLALAAATAINDYSDGAPVDDVRAWQAAAGVWKPGGAR